MVRKSMKDRVQEFTEGTKAQEDLVMLNTRIPKALLKTLKLHVVEHDTTMGKFVIEAIKKELERQTTGRG